MKETRIVEIAGLKLELDFLDGVPMDTSFAGGMYTLNVDEVFQLVLWLSKNVLDSSDSIVKELPPKEERKKSPYVNDKDQTVIPGMIDRSKELKGTEVVKFGAVTSSTVGVGVPLEDRKAK